MRAARANGRFPQAQIVETVPGSDGTTVFLRTTFGILVSRDAGKTWRWVCERAFGYEGQWDPPIAVTRDGRLWVGLERGLVSTIDACTVDTSPELDGETIKDLTTDAKGETIWALTGSPSTPEKRGGVWRRSIAPDAGTKWERIGSLPEGINPMTIEIAPSKASRLYVSGQPFETVRGWLFRSDDGGKTFAGGKNDLTATGPFFIAGVDAKDADRVLVRHLHTEGSDVLLTTDGGKTLKNVLNMKSAMFGFTKGADGTYWAGSGLPEHGIYQSTDRGGHFERVSNVGVLCLHAGPGDRLFVCQNPIVRDTPAMGLSMDRGKTVQSLSGFGDIQPLRCEDGGASLDAGAALCGDAWAETLALLTPRDGGAPKPRRRRDAGVDSGSVASSSADGGEAEAPPVRRSACGCKAIGHGSTPDLAWLTAGLIPLVVWARARRRPGSP